MVGLILTVCFILIAINLRQLPIDFSRMLITLKITCWEQNYLLKYYIVLNSFNYLLSYFLKILLKEFLGCSYSYKRGRAPSIL